MNSCLPFAGNLLLLETAKNGFSTNVVVSPLSLNAVAAMVAAGCSELTLHHVLSHLGCNTLEDVKSMVKKMMAIATSSASAGSSSGGGQGDSPKISFVNGVWVDQRFSLKPYYQKYVTHFFKSEAKNVDFLNQPDESVNEINSWAQSQTNGLITNVLQASDTTHLTKIILGNALYFKGDWEYKFDRESTENRDFFLLDGHRVSVPFMTSSNYYQYGTFEHNRVLEIPYQRGKKDGKKFTMQFILPNKKDGLQNLLDKFNSESGYLNWQFQLEETQLNELWIPKFKFTCTLDNLRYPFMEKGVELTEMVETIEPVVSRIIQKAFIEVDEEGTEAAAVTFDEDLGMAFDSEPQPIKRFVADHPFIFIIKEEKSGLVFFVGAVLNPLLQY